MIFTFIPPTFLTFMSKMSQEFLEAEKSTKESLAHEASEARELLSEEKALVAVERGRLAEEVEARQRLEALLAAETRKEDEIVRFVFVEPVKNGNRRFGHIILGTSVGRFFSSFKSVMIFKNNIHSVIF